MATKNTIQTSYRPVEEYLRLPYTLEVIQDVGTDGPGVWFAQVKELPGCMTEADTFVELQEMIVDAMRAWIESAMEDGETIPEPKTDEKYSGKFVTRVPPSLHHAAARAAEEESVSLNLWVATQLARAVGLPAPKGRVPQGPERPSEEEVDTESVVVPRGMPAPSWPRLTDAAWHALNAAGSQSEAKDVDELLFGQWLEKKLALAQMALDKSFYRDVLDNLADAEQALSFCTKSSILMSVFHMAVQMLRQHVDQLMAIQRGNVQESILAGRTSVQVELRARNRVMHIKDLEDSGDQNNSDVSPQLVTGFFARETRVVQ